MHRKEERISDRYDSERSSKFYDYISKEMHGRSSKHKNVLSTCFRVASSQIPIKQEETLLIHLKYIHSLRYYHKIKSISPKEEQA